MNEMLKIVEMFWTFQGEGFHAGRRSLFVRMPYCNLACPWCDTDFNKYTPVSESDFTKFATQEPGKFAVLTGGEPMMNKQSPRIIKMLKALGFEIACETNGTMPILDGIDFVTVSPKRYSQDKHQPRPPVGNGMGNYPAFHVHEDAMKKAHEFKYVVEKDFDFALLARHDVRDGRRYSLSPEYNDMKAAVEKIELFIKANPEWRLSLQTHKWIGVP